MTWEDLHSVRGVGIGQFHHVVGGLHRKLTEFIRQVVVRRGDESIRGFREWLQEDPLVHPYKWLKAWSGALPLPFFSVSLI